MQTSTEALSLPELQQLSGEPIKAAYSVWRAKTAVS